jgi:hypothetical protein
MAMSVISPLLFSTTKADNIVPESEGKFTFVVEMADISFSGDYEIAVEEVQPGYLLIGDAGTPYFFLLLNGNTDNIALDIPNSQPILLFIGRYARDLVVVIMEHFFVVKV